MGKARRYELEAGTSKKFWEIEVSGKTFTARWGRIGTTGQEKTQTFGSPAEAKKEAEKLEASKVKKGYRAAGAPKAPRPALPEGLTVHDEGLAARIRERRDDPSAYLVYADWLTEHASPVGELITVQHALAKGKDAALSKRETQLLASLALPARSLATVGFRFGLFDWLRLENAEDWMSETFDPLALAGPLFAHTACGALRELRIGILRWDENDRDVPAVLRAAGERPWAQGLERLHLGDVSRDIDMAHHVVGAVGAVVTASFPKLRWLKIHSGEQTWRRKNTFVLAGLELPELEELVVETCSLSRKRLAEVLGARLPELERLALWFGSEDQGANCRAKDLEPLLSGEVFPGVVHLGLQNAEFSDDLARRLPGSAIAARLASLDLSLGTLTDEGARALAAGAARFPALQRLDVNDNFLSDAGLAALRAGFRCEVASKEQKADEDPDYRYVSVSE